MKTRRVHRYIAAMLGWVTTGAAIFWLDGKLDLANLAMLLVLASALSSIWLSAWVGMNRPGFPRRLGASGSDAAQTRQAAGRQHWNDDVWGYRTFRCS